jgi:hyperosmotically inducible protein
MAARGARTTRGAGPMIRTGWDRVAVAALLTTAALLTYRAEAQEPDQPPSTGRRIGERLDDAAAALRRDAGRAGDAIRDEFHKVKASVNAMGIEGRVYGRVRWDKALDGATIDVSAARDGAVTLTGTVADAAAKAKAVRLATETMGVSRVVDQLAVAPAPRTTDAPR